MSSGFLSESGFDDIFQKVSSKRVLKSSMESLEDHRVVGVARSAEDGALALGPQREFFIQQYLRGQFDKPGVNNTGIAEHPDFSSLVYEDRTVKQYVSTLFIDIKGSTRLSLLYDLEFIYKFKNAVLQTCIEIVRSFDGYVHRLMGDALMAFFGSQRMDKEQAAIDSINCALMCKLTLEKAIKPWLEKQKGFDASTFGFRIGCNFGDDHEVLWGNYGFGDLGEVSPTGLPVDLAAKLQGLANKNEIMIGQGIIDFILWPEEYSSVKTQLRDGKEEEVPFVLPNYRKVDGDRLNYSMRLLGYENCLEYLPIDPDVKSNLKGSKFIANSSISFKCHVGNVDGQMQEYISATRFLEKGLDLVFEMNAVSASRIKFPLSVTFRKKNHGPDVPADQLGEDVETEVVKLDKKSPYSSCRITRETSYRGLHTMACEVRDSDGQLIYRNKIAVLIK
ncbi:nucleotide-binding domain-containing protein [Pseudomonas citronellolis]|uniref:nucleotide-binding domain-containing protein n=1 Tax=Pseudomonas citronellolis TaxID=53408 RepID=UPI0022BA59FD|nr:adenylate/guanylate cyclase domain-containing protein [Pseudomonas citronellolis]WBG63192.1 adenylate/guanylate cyclase domain-containing protein [Pseudomonas citronellolis]